MGKWQDGMDSETVLKHYGYEDTEDIAHGFWRKEVAPEWFKNISKMEMDWTKKIQVIFEYDPDFPRAYLRVTGMKQFSRQ